MKQQLRDLIAAEAQLDQNHREFLDGLSDDDVRAAYSAARDLTIALKVGPLHNAALLAAVALAQENSRRMQSSVGGAS